MNIIKNSGAYDCGVAFFCILLSLIFTGINFTFPIQGYPALLFPIPGLIGILLLTWRGNTHAPIILFRLKKISLVSFLLLLPPFLIFLFVPIFHKTYSSAFMLLCFLIPISALSQELFFRSVLQTAFLRAFHRKNIAVLIQSLLFVLWHSREFFHQKNISAVIVAAVLLFLLGLMWGYHALREKTILYTFIAHYLILIPVKIPIF